MSQLQLRQAERTSNHPAHLTETQQRQPAKPAGCPGTSFTLANGAESNGAKLLGSYPRCPSESTMTQAEYIAWWSAVNERRQDQDVTFDGITVGVRKNVFCPDPNMTHLPILMTHLTPNLSGKKVLDIGTGCGVLAVHAASKGASKIVATDIDREALANARENVLRHGLEKTIDLVESDLFDKVSGQYDLIYANLPILDSFWSDRTGPVATMYQRFINNVGRHLTEKGVALLGFASFGDMNAAEELILRSPLLRQELSERKFGVEWFVFELGHRQK
jgi:methylase of polypeptide subunit release factors